MSATSADADVEDWYEELFKNELKEVEKAQVVEAAADTEYEVYYYNRHFGLDFALGQHTGCVVVAGVDASQQARVAPGDIVLEANSTRLATSKHHRPRMGFFAAISIIRYAALPVTLRFLRKSRAKVQRNKMPVAALSRGQLRSASHEQGAPGQQNSQGGEAVAMPAARTAFDAAHELHGVAAPLLQYIDALEVAGGVRAAIPTRSVDLDEELLGPTATKAPGGGDGGGIDAGCGNSLRGDDGGGRSLRAALHALRYGASADALLDAFDAHEGHFAALPLPPSWRAVAARNETIGRLLFAPHMRPVINGARVPGNQCMEKLAYLLGLRMRTRAEIERVTEPIAFLLRGGANAADAAAVIEDLFVTRGGGGGSGVGVDGGEGGGGSRAGAGQKPGCLGGTVLLAPDPKRRPAFEVVVDDGVVVRSTHWFTLTLVGDLSAEEGGSGNTDASTAATAQLTVKAIVKSVLVPSKPTAPSRTLSVSAFEAESRDEDDSDEEHGDGADGSATEGAEEAAAKVAARAAAGELDDIFGEQAGGADGNGAGRGGGGGGAPKVYTVELGRGEAIQFVEGAGGEAITPLDEKIFPRSGGGGGNSGKSSGLAGAHVGSGGRGPPPMGPAEASARVGAGHLLVEVEGEDVRGLAFELVMAVLRGSPDGGRALTLCRPRPTIVPMPNTVQRSALRQVHVAKEGRGGCGNQYGGGPNASMTRRNFEFTVVLRRDVKSGFGFNLFHSVEGDHAMVEKFRPADEASDTLGAAEASGMIQPADVLVAVSGVEVVGMPFDSIIAELLQCEPGLKHALRFVRFPMAETDRLMAKAGFSKFSHDAPPSPARTHQQQTPTKQQQQQQQLSKTPRREQEGGGGGGGTGAMEAGGRAAGGGAVTPSACARLVYPAPRGPSRQAMLLLQFRALAARLEPPHMRTAMARCQALLDDVGGSADGARNDESVAVSAAGTAAALAAAAAVPPPSPPPLPPPLPAQQLGGDGLTAAERAMLYGGEDDIDALLGGNGTYVLGTGLDSGDESPPEL